MSKGYSLVDLTRKSRGKPIPDKKNVLPKLRKYYGKNSTALEKDIRKKVIKDMARKSDREIKQMYRKWEISKRGKEGFNKILRSGEENKGDEKPSLEQIKQEKLEMKKKILRNIKLNKLAGDITAGRRNRASMDPKNRADEARRRVETIADEGGDIKISGEYIGVKRESGITSALGGMTKAGDNPGNHISAVNQDATGVAGKHGEGIGVTGKPDNLIKGKFGKPSPGVSPGKNMLSDLKKAA